MADAHADQCKIRLLEEKLEESEAARKMAELALDRLQRDVEKEAKLARNLQKIGLACDVERMSNSSPSRILAIHAHPDDVEILCAGTLAQLKKRGCEITIATMTAGDKGSASLGPNEIAAIRRAEAVRSAEMLGAEYMCLEFMDLCIDNTDASRKRVTEALRKARPDIVITAAPVDYMSDHEMTSRLVRDACFAASVQNYFTDEIDPSPRTNHIPYLYYTDPIEGVDWFGDPVPYDFVVDVTDTFQLKIDMLACHESQRDWLRQQHGIDEYLDSCKRWCAKRGEEIGVTYAEGFRQHKGHAYPHENLLQKLLSE